LEDVLDEVEPAHAERPEGEPEEVRVYDFLDKTLGKAIL
jgi:hypothetical protein